MIRIPVDTNATARGGLVVASTRRATGPVRVGMVVEAQDIAECESFTARVDDIVGSKVYLRLDWSSGRPLVPDYSASRPDPRSTPLETWETVVTAQSGIAFGAGHAIPFYAETSGFLVETGKELVRQ